MKFPLIYADPAWTFETFSENGKDRSPEQHYACLSIDDIKSLPVGDLAADNSVCLMWVIDTHIPQALDVMASWGFKYKTVGFYYVKVGRALQPDMLMGYWTRANPEMCLLGTRGHPKRKGKDVARLILELDPSEQVIFAPRTKHSEKPLVAYDRIERLVDGPYLELFARHARACWHQWGNEVGKTGGTPNLIHMPGWPARAADNDNSLFGGNNAA